ncbi:alpha/beta hydrolase [Microbispora sp. ATCC PTA-5024]|uniref:alpha/beta hydrolase n=1 Tax=Microbispora sp. ATCC PTA-5024 TaxID=316330 RepID=UPI0003DDC737|nr:alpha/beta hydrolase-fold protein [Microbispora sp. ATCC PTA-5024]ETK37433.1 hypothetical protein MPTA5024_03920 [Microbispora sp. ATCC PTA-5024]
MDDNRLGVWTFERDGEQIAWGRPGVTDEERAAAGRETLAAVRAALLAENRSRAALAMEAALPEGQDVLRVWASRDPRDLRARLGGERLAVWAEGDVLHVLWRGEDGPPNVGGGLQPVLWPVDGAPDLWEASVRVRGLDEAVIELHVVPERPSHRDHRNHGEHGDHGKHGHHGEHRADGHVTVRWRGPRAPSPAPGPAEVTGVVERHELRFLGEARGVTVYRPPGAAGPLPGCVMADGQFVPALARTLEPAVLAGDVPPFVLVGVHCASGTGGADETGDARGREYIPSSDPPRFAAHLAFVADTVLGWARETCGAAAGPWIAAGVSNGADWALGAACRRPDVFRKVAALSPGSPPSQDDPSAAGGAPARCYLGAGTLESGFRESARDWAVALSGRGCAVRHEEWIGGHDAYWWSQRLPVALAFLLA